MAKAKEEPVKKTIAEFEKEKGCIVVRSASGNEIDPKVSITEEEFDAIPQETKIGVNHKDRIAFLKKNGYEVTRENMIDSSLSTKPTEE